ncbi:MAG: hypothetical protein EB015_14285, partial [Methylocystaceae bacterium]|nr:hypothetical protein [Methylocystaceae bacterium]
MADQLLRQIGLTARAVGPVGVGALGGAALAGPPGAAVGALGVGLGQMVGDPLVGLYNRAMGTNVPTPSQSMESLMTKVGLPEPATPTERVVQDITRSGASATGFARGAGQMGATMLAGRQMAGQPAGISPEILKLLAQYPAQQVSGAALAGGAGGMLREGDVGTAGQMAGSLAAGMVAPGGPKLPLTQRIVAAPKTLVQPFTEEGRQVMIGSVLNKLATNPQAAQARLAEAAPLVPGVRPTTAAAAFDPGLAAAETSIRGLDVAGSQFGQRLSENQQALLDAYRRLSGGPGSLPYAEAKRASVTGPMRTDAFDMRAPVTVDAIEAKIQSTLSDPAKQRTQVISAMQEVRNLIKARTAPDGTIDPVALYSVRKDIGDIMSGKLQGEKANLRLARGELADLMPVIDNVIESGAPGFNAYMSKYAKMSKPIDQMRLLQDIEARVTTGQPNVVTGEPVLAAGQLRRQLATRAEEIGADLSAPAQRRLDNIITEINRGMAATAPGVKVPGSDTFKNMSMGNLIGKIFSESLASNTTLRTM